MRRIDGLEVSIAVAVVIVVAWAIFNYRTQEPQPIHIDKTLFRDSSENQ